MAEPAVSRETGFQALSYSISLNTSDGTLQFYPPQGSPELAIALSLAFPRPKTLDEKMREAQLVFLQTHHVTIASGAQPKAITPTQIPMEVQPASQVEFPDSRRDKALKKQHSFTYLTRQCKILQPLRSHSIRANRRRGPKDHTQR